jgi:5-methyltetrahydrofolate--homocysteine methyltransferase
MKKAVAYLIPYIEREKGGVRRSNGKIVTATVKGDVHDIGKNIVGVVLQCNNFEIIDLGVMVPCEKILETARREKADIIGLSGLITPSLDEMVHVAKEMQRQKFSLPLLIGGATTSPAHTSVRIDPAYDGPVIYVKDASRSVGVAQTLITKTANVEYIKKIKEDCARRRDRHRGQSVKGPELSLADARANRFDGGWDDYRPPRPAQLGVRSVQAPLEALVDYIDWMPFFNAWEFAGRFPDILDDPVVGEAARSLYADARALLERIVAERWLEARGVLGLFAANSVEFDDIEVYADESRARVLARLYHLRQQKRLPTGQSHHCLADYVAPRESGVADYVGAFAVTAGIGIDALSKRFADDHDDYNAILLKALADRLAEAFAEYLHERVRKEHWGYARDESLSNVELIGETYRGIRPAPGYPACPDHTGKAALWQLLDPPANAGIELTESYAMLPTAAVSGFYFAHPGTRYFSVGKIGRDQVEDYARRKGVSFAEAERWLTPILGYEADAA